MCEPFLYFRGVSPLCFSQRVLTQVFSCLPECSKYTLTAQ